MTKQIDQLIKKMHDNGKLLSLQSQDSQNGVKHNWTSCYVKKKQMIVRGEHGKPSSLSRNALLTLTNGKTNQVMGMLYVVLFDSIHPFFD